MLLWEGPLPVECGYEDYPHFSLFIGENGYGYVLSSEGKALAYFNQEGVKSVKINEGYCLNFATEEENVTTVNSARVFKGCLAVAMWYKGSEMALYFYNTSTENFTFKAKAPKNIISSSNYLLARYENHSSVFSCAGEVMRIDGHYDEAYSFGDDFLLVRYEGNKAVLHLALTGRTYEFKSIKIAGTADGKIVAVKGSELLIINPRS